MPISKTHKMILGKDVKDRRKRAIQSCFLSFVSSLPTEVEWKKEGIERIVFQLSLTSKRNIAHSN